MYAGQCKFKKCERLRATKGITKKFLARMTVLAVVADTAMVVEVTVSLLEVAAAAMTAEVGTERDMTLVVAVLLITSTASGVATW